MSYMYVLDKITLLQEGSGSPFFFERDNGANLRKKGNGADV